MKEYTIKILGAQFAANPDYKFGDSETEVMVGRTIALLTELQESRPSTACPRSSPPRTSCGASGVGILMQQASEWLVW